jgi:RNA polymerase sigma-70 factor (ECF subfamily)
MTPKSKPELIAELFARRDLFLMFLRYRGFHCAADDILQTAYLRLLERGLSLHDERKMINWFYSVLRNAAIDYARATNRRLLLHERAACKLEVEAAMGDDHDEDRIATTLAMIEGLEPQHREVLDSVYVRGCSMTDVARQLGITRNAATVRVHRARRALGVLVKRAEDSVQIT